MEYKNTVLELAGDEGAAFQDFKITNSSFTSWRGKSEKPIRIYAKIIGFEDNKASMRNWGYRDVHEFKEKVRTITKIKYKTKKIWELKIPRSFLEKVIARFGFYRKI